MAEEQGQPRITYEERRKALQEKRIAEYKEKRRDLKVAVAQVAATAEGKTLLRWLVSECGFTQASTRLGTDGEIQTIGTVYNEARRNLWLDLRREVPATVLAELEAPPQEVGNDD